jgi:dTDP-4-amino-4,6-dideoxygalactose transaminase
LIYCSYPHAQYQSHKDEIDLAILKALASENYILGEEVKRFESSFASFCNATYGVGVNSGTDALIIALRAIDINPGDEVITTSHTALATVAAIVAAGAVPVLCDIERENYTIDTNKIEKLITKKTKAIIPVHIYGHPADMDEVIRIAGEFGLKVIEDCAQSAGGIYKGRRLGSIGDIGCFSFYPTKNLGAAGDGGMLITSDPDVAEKASAFRQYGWDYSRKTLAPGINSRLDEIQAAILNVKLRYLDDDNKKRQKIAAFYSKALVGKAAKVPKINLLEESIFHLYVIEVDDRKKLKTRLEENGIFPGIHYEIPVYKNGGYSSLCRVPVDGLGVTDNIVGRILSLPMYPELHEKDINRIVALI